MMINIVNAQNMGLMQSIHNPLEHLSEGQAIQTLKQEPRIDILELSDEAVSKSQPLKVPSQMTTEKPRAWSITIETLNSRISHVESSIQKADSLNLSFDDRLTFLENEGKSWVEGIKQSDPNMFVEWLKINKEHIETGQPDLASLPSEFTIKDYYSYVKEPFSVLA